MKKTIFGILSLYVLLPIWSIEYNTYKMEKVHVFNASHNRVESLNNLAVNNHPGSGSLAVGPGLFFYDNRLVISDQVSRERRTIILDENFTFVNLYDESFYNKHVLNFGYNVLGYNTESISGFNIKDNKWIFKYRLSYEHFSFIQDFNDVYYQDNTLFIFDDNDTLWGIKDPSLDNSKNKKNIVIEKDIIAEIKSGKYKGLTIDDKKRLFLNGELQTINYKVFYSYYKEIHPEKEKLSNNFKVGDIILEISPKSSSYMDYLGKDITNNSYWVLGQEFIVIFNELGLLDNFFRFDTKKSSTYPAVSPEGDVYFMSYGSDKVTLYKIKRQW